MIYIYLFCFALFLVQEAADLKLKLDKCEAEIETSRKANELNLLPLTNFTNETYVPLVYLRYFCCTFSSFLLKLCNFFFQWVFGVLGLSSRGS